MGGGGITRCTVSTGVIIEAEAEDKPSNAGGEKSMILNQQLDMRKNAASRKSGRELRDNNYKKR